MSSSYAFDSHLPFPWSSNSHFTNYPLIFQTYFLPTFLSNVVSIDSSPTQTIFPNQRLLGKRLANKTTTLVCWFPTWEITNLTHILHLMHRYRKEVLTKDEDTNWTSCTNSEWRCRNLLVERECGSMEIKWCRNMIFTFI